MQLGTVGYDAECHERGDVRKLVGKNSRNRACHRCAWQQTENGKTGMTNHRQGSQRIFTSSIAAPL